MSETTSPASKPAGGQFGGVWFFPWMIVLLLLGSLGIPSDWNPFSKHIEGMELWSYDLRIRLQGGVTFSSDKIVVVAIDDNSFETLGSKPATRQDSKWPFPNSFHAQVAKRLTDWGARAVAFDLLSFANPSRPRYQGEDEAFADVSSQTGRMIIAAKSGTKSKESWDLGFLGTEIMSEVWTTPASVFRQVPRGYINFPLEVNDTVRRYLPYYWRMAVKPINPFAIETLKIASCPGIAT